MAIIRNDRSAKREQEEQKAESVEELEEEIDYDWHPTEEEYVSPLTASQWAELLSDPSFSESDAAQAIRCLREYGSPATFQQLSIRYRGTMGRYRRWLSEAAQEAGQRFGADAPQQNQFGMDEWWPLLYQTRATGKPGAGVFEMQLRPEVEDGFLELEELERQARRAENARNLQRIEQLERARQEERRRVAEQMVQAAQTMQPAAAEEEADEVAEAQPEAEPVVAVADVPSEEVLVEPAEPVSGASLSAVTAFLVATHEDKSGGGSRFVPAVDLQDTPSFDVAMPLDYSLRYAERLRYVLSLMREAMPNASAASIARVLGDPSVQKLQDVLNGQEIPSFAYLDLLRDRIFVNAERLEVPDGQEESCPAFCSLHELFGTGGVAPMLEEGQLSEIAYVVDDSKDRRTGVIMRFGKLRCALLTRVPVHAEAQRDKSPELDAFTNMVDELDGFAREKGIARTSHQVTAEGWDALVKGTVWPGTVLG